MTIPDRHACVSNPSLPSQSLLSVTFRLSKLLVFICVPTFHPDPCDKTHPSSFQALSGPSIGHTFGLDEAFPFHNLWSPRELLLSNTTVEHFLSQIINWISFFFIRKQESYLWSMNYTLVCYGLLILGRSHSAPVAASTTASGLQAAALRTTQSKSIPASKLHRVSDQCPQSYWFPLCIKGNSYQGIFHTINTEIYGVISTFLSLSNF